MTDYYPQLSKAVSAQAASPFSVREAIYASARDALTRALRTLQPPVPAEVIRTEEEEFEAAVARVESEVREHWGEAPTSFLFRRDPRPPVSGDLRLSTPRHAPTTPDFIEPDPIPEPEPEHEPAPEKERPMSRLDELNKILRKLQSDSPGLEASALISEDGLMIASALTPELEENRVAGMTATLLNLGTRAAIELARGEVKEVIIRGDHGYAVMINAGRGALLLALANESAKLGLIFFDMNEAIRGLKKVL